ncbi:protein TIC 22 [Citrus sinensis]|uniref:Protein TIC 22 n=2 Tax=Citrus sinensis TaxID=2711 RepID=A0ACB8KV16_CITSI|nr:protein TIC 22 [Citrus sinensis]
MEFPKSQVLTNPLLSLSTFIHQNCLRLGSELSSRLDDTKRTLSRRLQRPPLPVPPFAFLSQPKQALAATLSSDFVSKTLAGTAVYTVSNSSNEFVLISDPNGAKSIGLLCFRQEDAEAFLAQVRLRRKELRSAAKVVPITLDQVYMLKVEGIAFRFVPDPAQIRNALELKAADVRTGFDGVPVFQPRHHRGVLRFPSLKARFSFGAVVAPSELLVVKKKNKRYCPVYFQKEDIEKELSKVSRASRGAGVSQHIMVGSLEDVLKKMETSEKNSGWEDLIFIPPGKSHSQHIQEVAKVVSVVLDDFSDVLDLDKGNVGYLLIHS